MLFKYYLLAKGKYLINSLMGYVIANNKNEAEKYLTNYYTKKPWYDFIEIDRLYESNDKIIEF